MFLYFFGTVVACITEDFSFSGTGNIIKSGSDQFKGQRKEVFNFNSIQRYANPVIRVPRSWDKVFKVLRP